MWYRYCAFIASFLFCVAISISTVYAIVYGSNTSVSRQSLRTFPEVDTNNRMRGFVAFENGFILETFKTTCTFDSFYPVGAIANLNGGLLWLNRDLKLEDTLAIPTVGTFASNNKSMILSTTGNYIIPSGDDSTATFALKLVATQSYADTVRTVDWLFDSRFVVAGAQTGATNEFVVYSFDNTTLTQRATEAFSVDVVTVSCSPNDYYIALGTNASSSFDEFRVYQFDPVSYALTLTASNNYGAMASVIWHPTGNYIAVVGQGSSQDLTVFSFINGTLTQVASSTISPSSTIIYDIMDWDPTGNYLALGTFSGDTLLVYQFTGTSLSPVASQVMGASGIAGVDWSPTNTAHIAVGLNKGSQRLRIYDFNASAGTLTDRSSAYIGEATAAIQDVHWNPDGTALVIGRISGSGTDFRLYSFDKDTVSFSLVMGVNISASVTNARFSPNGAYIAEGDAVSNLNIYMAKLTGPNDEIIFTNLKTILYSNLILRKPLRFKGNCTINGRNNTLYIDTGSELRVDAGASVLLENLMLDNVQNTNVRCLDSLGTITLSNIIWQQENTFTFTQGRFIFEHDVVISGSQIFSYQSAQQSTIDQCSTLIFDTGMTFSYAPSSNSRTLISMIDSSSQLYLQGATLQSTATGLQLTKGTLIIDGRCEVQSAATVVSEGVMFGDGTAQNELTIKVLPESGIDVISGFLVYDNIT